MRLCIIFMGCRCCTCCTVCTKGLLAALAFCRPVWRCIQDLWLAAGRQRSNVCMCVTRPCRHVHGCIRTIDCIKLLLLLLLRLLLLRLPMAGCRMKGI